MSELSSDIKDRPTVGVFVTCLVDTMRPEIAWATVKLLEDAGCTVIVPMGQSCCGQPAYNAGDTVSASKVAKGLISAFKDCDYIVAPSGSCAGMLRLHLPELLKSEEAKDLASRFYELSDFLVNMLDYTPSPLKDVNLKDAKEADTDKLKIAYHDSCSAAREINVYAEPRRLIESATGIAPISLGEKEACCGFGGLFAVKYSNVSNKIVTDKSNDIAATGASILSSGDLGCLMNIAGRIRRQGRDVRCYHWAEIAAFGTDHCAIGEPDSGPQSP